MLEEYVQVRPFNTKISSSKAPYAMESADICLLYPTYFFNIMQMLLEDESLCLNEELYQFLCPNFENTKELAP